MAINALTGHVDIPRPTGFPRPRATSSGSAVDPLGLVQRLIDKREEPAASNSEQTPNPELTDSTALIDESLRAIPEQVHRLEQRRQTAPAQSVEPWAPTAAVAEKRRRYIAEREAAAETPTELTDAVTRLTARREVQ